MVGKRGSGLGLGVVHPLPQFQPRLEVNPAVVAKFYGLTGLGIPRCPWRVVTQGEAAEPANFDAAIVVQGLDHVVDDVLHSNFDIGGMEVGIPPLKSADEIRADHGLDRGLLTRHEKGAKVGDDE